MHARAICLAGLAAIALSATANAGEWKYGQDPRGNDELTYHEDGKIIFFMGCGRAFGLHIRYPGKAAKSGDATLTISAGRQRMTFKGEFEEPDEEFATTFLQWDLGYARPDPRLFGKGWKAKEMRLFDLLESGRPLTIAAGKDHYQLPPVDAKGWREPLNHCG